MILGGVVMLNVSDVDRAVRFWIETLGMKLVAMDGPSAGGATAIIDAGDGFRVGLRAGSVSAEERATKDPRVVLTLKIPFDDAVAILDNRGVAFDVHKTQTGAIATFRDEDGNLLAIAPTA